MIFYDSEFQIAVEKAQAMKAEIQKCKGCSVLAMDNVPIREAQTRMPALVAALVRKYGSKLTDLLAINGNYFAGSGAALLALGIPGDAPPFAVAAGDGDASEFARIRSGNYQAASVAEALYLQGWQLIDEISRALAHQPASHYLAPPRLITKADVPAGGVFDPSTSRSSPRRQPPPRRFRLPTRWTQTSSCSTSTSVTTTGSMWRGNWPAVREIRLRS